MPSTRVKALAGGALVVWAVGLQVLCPLMLPPFVLSSAGTYK